MSLFSPALEVQRLNVKLRFAESGAPQLKEALPIFHRWIQSHRLSDELLLDVVDYRHVHRGPGVGIICHGAEYLLDGAQGQLGLVYRRKRALSGTFEERLAATVRSLLVAARHLEEEPAARVIRFRGDALEITFNDRLLAPNDASTRNVLRPILEGFGGRLFDGPFLMKDDSAPAECLRFELTGAASSTATLLGSLS